VPLDTGKLRGERIVQPIEWAKDEVVSFSNFYQHSLVRLVKKEKG
jgi:hypothetical protein